MELKKNMNTIFRSGSLLIKAGLTLGVLAITGIFIFLGVAWVGSDMPLIQVFCGLPMFIIAFCIGIIGLIAGVWTLQDLIGWTKGD